MSKRGYIIVNRKWLEDKAKEEGVKALPNGIYDKVLKSGDSNGVQLQKRSIVTILYRLDYLRQKSDTSIGGTPIAMRLSDLIDGWIIALQQMHVGDQWELYIPAEMGYGKYSQPGIPGGSTLIFDIELIGVAWHET